MAALPALPTVLLPLMHALELPPGDVNVARVVELVSYDESIVAQCIRMANSAMFGRRRTVESVHDAVVTLGLWRVSDIVFSCTVPQMLSSIGAEVDPAVFWRHSLCCALVSQRLAKLLRSHSAEKAYLAGLLHDMGMLVNSILYPQEFREAFEKAAATHTPLDEAEREVLGFTHAESGRVLADQWHFSADITAVMEFHHDVTAATSAKDLVAIVHLSDSVCRHQGMGYGYLESCWIDFCYSPAWLVLLRTCKSMPFPDIAGFSRTLQEYCEEVAPLVDQFLGPKVHTPQATPKEAPGLHSGPRLPQLR
jgi:HD-like signal output (HDOD) protein